MSSLDAVQHLKRQRALLAAGAGHRLFKPVKGDDLASMQLCYWHIPRTNYTTWPLRIAGLHNKATPEVIIDLIIRLCEAEVRDVILFITYLELDGTRTIDIGLRYSEDAFWIWCILHGVLVDGYPLEVYPIHAMRGEAFFYGQIAGEKQRCASARIRRYNWLLLCEDVWPHEGFGEQLSWYWRDAFHPSEVDQDTDDVRTSKHSVRTSSNRN